MAIISIKPWALKGTMVQLSTRWEFTKDKDGKLPIKQITTTDKEMFILKDTGTYTDLDMLYVRPVRVFESSEIPLERVAIPMKANLANNVVYRDGSAVKQPLVYVDEDEYNDERSPDFTIYTSAYSATQDQHLATNWIIQDADGNVILTYLRDRFNKTSVRVPKLQLDKYNYFKVIVQHISASNVESSPGVLEIYKNNGEQFSTLKEIDNVDPNVDLNIYLSPASVFSGNLINSIYLRTISADNTVLDKVAIDIPSTNPIVIPNRYLSYNKLFYLDIFSQDTSGNLVKTTITINTKLLEDLPAKSYDRVLEKVNDQTGLNLPIGFSCSEYVFGNFLLPLRSSNKVKVNTLRQETREGSLNYILTVGASERSDVAMNSVSNDNMFCYFHNGYLITDSQDTNSKPVFQVYSYNKLNDEFTLLHMKRREETLPVGYDNNVFFHNGKMYYKINNTTKLMEYDYIANTLVEYHTLPDNLTDSTLIYNPLYKKVLFSCRDKYFRVLDMESKTIESGADIPFTIESGERLKHIQLDTGDSLILNINLSNEIIEMGHYDYKSSLISKIDISAMTRKKHSGFILSNYNCLFLLNSSDDTHAGQTLYRYY